MDYRKIAERYFDKKLLPDEVVHHIDGNRENNNPENLVIMKKTQHLKLHGSLFSGLSEWQKKKNKGICVTCLYVNLYELNDPNIKDILYELADGMMNWGKIKREDALLDAVYNNSKEWKKQNNHDCYQNKNMEIVK